MAKRGHGEGTIGQAKDGRWVARISVDGGKRKAFYSKSRREVQLKLDAARRAQQDGLPVVPERQTVGQYLSKWLEGARSSVRAKTFETYDLNVRRVLPLLSGKRLAALTPADIQACYAALLERGLKGKRGLSRRSVRQAHEMLHRALKQAVEWGMMARNPADSASPPRPDRKEMQTLAEHQVQQLFAVTADDRHHALWVLLVTTGLRLGEATGLRWSDVDLDAGTLTVQRALQRRRKGGLVFVEPKSVHSRRTVHLVDDTVTELRAHRKRLAEERLGIGPAWDDQGLVFPTQLGGPMPPETVTDALGRALTKADLPKIRVHDLRHTAATLQLEWGTNPKVVQEMLGHSTISITLDLYSHVAPALHREAVKHFSRLF